MKMENLGYYNGRIDRLENLQIPLNDRGYYFGDGVYDASYMENNRIFDLERHIDRFFSSADLIDIALEFTKNDLKNLLLGLAKQVESRGYLAYWQITRGTGTRKHYSTGLIPNLAVMFLPSGLWEENRPMKVMTYPDKRYAYCNVKSLNLIPNVLGAAFGEKHGCDEVIFLRKGIVTECAHSNVHILKDGIVYTHPADEHILPGIARLHMLQACDALGIPWFEQKFNEDALFLADEVLITSSATPCSRVKEIDRKPTRQQDEEVFTRLKDYIYDEMYKELRINTRRKY